MLIWIRRQLFASLLIAAICLAVFGCDSSNINNPPAPTTIITTTSPSSVKPLEKGIAVVWYDHSDDSVNSLDDQAKNLAHYVIGLNANSVMVNIPIYTTDYHASSVYAGDGTPTPVRLRRVLKVLAAANLRVSVRYLIDEQTLALDGKWRGVLEPTNRAAWFDSLARLIASYAPVLNDSNVARVIIAAELTSLADDISWTSLAANLQPQFAGKLSSSLNWDNAAPSSMTKALPAGLDAYFPLDLPSTATTAELAAGFDGWFQKMTARGFDLHQLVIDETGIASSGAHFANPWSASSSSAQDYDAQARWITAMCLSAKKTGIPGIYWWKVDLHAKFDKPASDLDHSIVGKPASEAVKACYA
jgi:hypothetical protein